MSAYFGRVFLPCRRFSTTQVDFGKRNFRKFLLYGKRGSRLHKQKSKELTDRELLQSIDRGVRPSGYHIGNDFKNVPEMIPELIVPDLTGFELKPYVSYRVPDVVQGEFRPQDLFYAVYSKKIADDFKNGKLDSDGEPMEPSEAESLTAEVAKGKANLIGNDKFSEKTWAK
ncbi:39S ribosomal protein L41, mitochondrial [Halocaridina rubra]|uniref:39S ribosomal protein L41, mitochondrial n=1 Tax=Halocaridina rubra TaxID=373956 RepID=A0AAN8X5C0_HALRR